MSNETKNILRCPATIKVLLHCHCIPEPVPNFQYDGVADESVKKLLELKAIESDDGKPGCYRTTELGKSWVDVLCNVPIPRTAFVDQMGKVIRFLE